MLLDEHGEHQSVEATGWYARILQHEIDHLQGTLYIDRMHSRTFASLDNWNRFWKAKPMRAVLKDLGLEHLLVRRFVAHRAGFRSDGYLACFFANRALNIVLITTMPAKKITSVESSPLETFPTRNRM
jgi:hypothetical protein